MNQTDHFHVGKLPQQVLEDLLKVFPPSEDPRVLIGPGVGVDCAILDVGETLLAVKSDPITFAADNIGWYAVHINANDIATTGATPRWFTATILLPENTAERGMVDRIFHQLQDACTSLGVVLIGGHTEITAGLDRPIIAGTMLGDVTREDLVTPRGMNPGDRILITKGIPIEAASILATELDLAGSVSADTLNAARQYLSRPGISVVRDARCACEAGGVSAMHDPTEGGILTGLHELAYASGTAIVVNPARIPVLPPAKEICRAAGINPLEAIASGALLIAVHPSASDRVLARLDASGIHAIDIGVAEEGNGVWFTSGEERQRMYPPERDAIARLFENEAGSSEDEL